jgi:hypothetical protein
MLSLSETTPMNPKNEPFRATSISWTKSKRPNAGDEETQQHQTPSLLSRIQEGTTKRVGEAEEKEGEVGVQEEHPRAGSLARFGEEVLVGAG